MPKRRTFLTKEQAVAFYGTQRALAEALDITEAAVSLWDVYVPDARAWQLELLTGGALKASHSSSSEPQLSRT